MHEAAIWKLWALHLEQHYGAFAYRHAGYRKTMSHPVGMDDRRAKRGIVDPITIDQERPKTPYSRAIIPLKPNLQFTTRGGPVLGFACRSLRGELCKL